MLRSSTLEVSSPALHSMNVQSFLSSAGFQSPPRTKHAKHASVYQDSFDPHSERDDADDDHMDGSSAPSIGSLMLPPAGASPAGHGIEPSPARVASMHPFSLAAPSSMRRSLMDSFQ